MCSTAAPTTPTSASATNNTHARHSNRAHHHHQLPHHQLQPQLHPLHEALLAGRALISTMELKLRCSASGCECANFVAAKEKLRSCDGCSHSWITHLFEKLLRDENLSVFDVCSLALYGTHALPIRLKIVIERLLGTLQPEEIDKILRSFGWTPPDLARGYMIQDPRGGLLTRWSMLPREEEILILQQFLRFNPTRSLSFALLRDDFPAPPFAASSSPPTITEPPPRHHHSHSHHARDRDNHRPSKPPPQPPPPDEPVLNLSALQTAADSSSEDDDVSPPPVDLSAKRCKSEEPQNQSMKTDGVKAEPPQQRQHWSPTANATQLVNPATGKRRVQCSVCLKTFCDKGALKIHFSAVHLREMHKCTVAGCNMMFSSRRSRNRHSANPNPKLHSPHLRRRISPHDGRTCQPVLNIRNPLLGSVQGMIPGFTNGVKEEEGHEVETMIQGDDSCSSVSMSSVSEKSPSATPEESRKDGARKRKLSNPVRLPSVPDDSNDDFCCYDDGTEVVQDEDGEDEKNHLERLESLPIFNSNHSDSGSNDDSSPNSTDGDSFPIDKENPRRCIACGKLFQNHFGVKTHYQNVHLKCTVDGCNAAFPSKRSRDRHSANLNLHRKLLSTTSDASNGSSEEPPRQTIFNPFLVNGTASSMNHVTTPPWNPFLPFPLFPSVFQQQQQQPPVIHTECRFCGKSFEQGPTLQSHMESAHAAEGHRCRNCNVLFFSRRKLETHSCRGSSNKNGTQ